MCHKWRDMKQQTFMNVVACSPEGAVFLNSFEVSDDRESGVYLKDLLSSAIEDIGPEHVVQFITDSASNFESAGDMLVGKYPHMYKTRCVAHGIQLLLRDMYDDVSWIQQVLDDSKLIFAHIYDHTDVLSMMRVHTNGRELKRPCVTRFASYFLMLQSILNVGDELRRLVASSEWMRLDYSKKEMAEKVTATIQSSEYWSQSQEVLQVMEPLVRVLYLVDGYVSTSGYLYEAMERAKEIIKERCSANESKYMKILDLFEYRRRYIIHPIHAAAAFLNPAYMYSEKFVEDCEMKKGINFILENLVSCDEKEAFMRQVQVYREKLSSLFTTTATTMMKTSHPRIWWDYCGDTLPILKKYAVRILSQPCSSSTCAKRNKLKTNMFDNLVHMRMNMFMMEEFNTMEAEKLVPINLDKVNEFIECDYEQDGFENELPTLNDKSTPNDVMNEEDFPRNCVEETHFSESRSLQLHFSNNLSLPGSTISPNLHFPRKEKLGHRITKLHQLVSPFGKADTDSVLFEAIEYIQFLHGQVTVLSTPYIKCRAAARHQRCNSDHISKDPEDPKQDLRSRGLCLVPVSITFPVTHETTVDFCSEDHSGHMTHTHCQIWA
ncbi:Ribonuclease H-like domain containing protein [Trema orientale]|uniref:Ribonuclease H-like domain containing protein n=1 Tax=Trema orientale TaxID=63057 RepID=A0A2P5FTR2_TREOI|nr:Ribonuclease H-like domain containing protein [Trema orientale]